jgi:transposase
MKSKGLKSLFSFKGYVLEKIHFSAEIVQATLRRDKRYSVKCPDCGRAMTVRRENPQGVRDLAFGPAVTVVLVYPAVQGYCPRCRKRATVLPPGILPHAKATWRLMKFVSLLCRHMPNTAVGEVLGLHDVTVGRWDRAVLAAELPEPDFDAVDKLLVDEKHLGARHGYVTVVLDADTGALLHMAEGKKKESLQSFFDKLSPAQKAAIKAVCLDRAGHYRAVVEDNCQQAVIVYDRFHIMKNYNDTVDEVRRREAAKASASEKKLIWGQRFNLLRNPENRGESAEEQLRALLDVNENLNLCNILRDALRQLWRYRYRAWAERYLYQWNAWARASGIRLLEQFADILQKHADGILNYFKYRITQGPIESFNNVIARTIHRACGMNDLDYLYLKLRQQSLNKDAQT